MEVAAANLQFNWLSNLLLESIFPVNCPKDYLKLLTYGDSLYRCKCLKVAALGRMCTVVKRITPSLAYLEQIRQHMTRLLSIDPNTRTVLICGYPNVGKSSFMNKVTRADVDVQLYTFTTKSLFVVVTLMLISCGYTISQQAALFHSIKSLFMNKPLVIVCNKTDLMPMENLSEEDKKLIEEMKVEAMKTAMGASEEEVLLKMSTLNEEGVMAVKNAACERLLDQRVEALMKSKKINDHLNRFHVAMPKPRDSIDRPAFILQVVLEAKAQEAVEMEKRKTEKNLEEENGGAGVYSASLKKHYILHHDEWKEDIIPEILVGHNVADFIDPDILTRLEELQREEKHRDKKGLQDELAHVEFLFRITNPECTEHASHVWHRWKNKLLKLLQPVENENIMTTKLQPEYFTSNGGILLQKFPAYRP